MNNYFGITQISRAIKTHGQDFIFKRAELDINNEPTDRYNTVATIQGLFHQTRGYITKNTNDGTQSRSKPQPQILTLLSEGSKLLLLGDELEYNQKRYTVTGVDDINNLGIALDISLEEIDNGT